MAYRGNRRVRLLLIIGAHLVVLGLLFQVAAFDHWHMGFQDVQGVQGSSAHVHASHCHGEIAGCADAGGAVAKALNSAEQFAVPRSAYVFLYEFSVSGERASSAFLASLGHPPQAT